MKGEGYQGATVSMSAKPNSVLMQMYIKIQGENYFPYQVPPCKILDEINVAWTQAYAAFTLSCDAKI